VADPAFLPAAVNAHWSSTARGEIGPNYAMGIIPDVLIPGAYYKRQDLNVRAVRSGS
jgi:hypothetical protein